MPERLTVESLTNGAAVLVFFPFTYAMTQFFESENFTHISIWLKCYHINWVPGCHCVGSFVHFYELGNSHRLYVVDSQLPADVLLWKVWGYTF
jgi:hypothetical protein